MGLDANAVVQLLLRERVRLTAAAVAVLRDVHTADDVFQQIVLAALGHPDHFRDPDHLLAWSLRAARHRAVDAARRRRVQVLDADVLDALEAHWADTPAADPPARVEALQHCLGRLPAAGREVLRLRYEGGLSCGEVAGRLRRSVDAVYQTLSRLHRRLRECVEEQLNRPATRPEEAAS
jgi:RNA polymerase sigma-70 factor (ECF subfamily)